jgi:hypothetical protein
VRRSAQDNASLAIAERRVGGMQAYTNRYLTSCRNSKSLKYALYMDAQLRILIDNRKGRWAKTWY